MQLAQARHVSRDARARELDRIAADALSVDQAAALLGISARDVRWRIADEELVVLLHNGRLVLPRWQFTGEGALSGLAEAIAAYPGDALSVSVWATSPCADLAGATPAEALRRRGGTARVLAAVRPLTPDAW